MRRTPQGGGFSFCPTPPAASRPVSRCAMWWRKPRGTEVRYTRLPVALVTARVRRRRPRASGVAGHGHGASAMRGPFPALPNAKERGEVLCVEGLSVPAHVPWPDTRPLHGPCHAVTNRQ